MKIIEKDIINDAKENMDEGEFISILKWSSIKAFVTMIIVAFVALVVVPWAVKTLLALLGIMEGAPATLIISIIATTLVFYYAFHVSGLLDAIKWFLISVAYSVTMYIGGELIFMAMLFVGVIVTVIFLAGDAGLTGLYTYIGLKDWVESKKRRESIEAGTAIQKMDPSQKS